MGSHFGTKYENAHILASKYISNTEDISKNSNSGDYNVNLTLL